MTFSISKDTQPQYVCKDVYVYRTLLLASMETLKRQDLENCSVASATVGGRLLLQPFNGGYWKTLDKEEGQRLRESTSILDLDEFSSYLKDNDVERLYFSTHVKTMTENILSCVVGSNTGENFGSIYMDCSIRAFTLMVSEYTYKLDDSILPFI